ncbi:23S rRNA (guanosine(2251)-2'-O)-methyltransferase RlmB [Buchananella hordeovulneris]|uniref:23S rRNA (Guanosine(2251)-2'-O)-methyltransferase RlmB n=1 Tax=Buchananella hordeovulneris TaxID=52770 RepID=A0A1Q5PTH4_9ACTO|nr:23S rRNA (guanosine(2251)-2'-O)-methyltransferase RlmB [Buchananella hordeovulneris]MDO5080812.1 23S rRNA (guanosine(2251)-2'-O)-methyltransferase RlmB [Buchananella hordeovulneris]OKL50901.1 23S rRNA (guanosine(2251)-2'-O)-methyltransferase RlmB [Buchananella hordeovulneris]RRD42491.1 23S rRNA (guanosine(2251)-2'-O)-methyltransferase RlmB [Buchananella hordeovulneris]RRD53531.1 23S rRNA (guanosine(2251)-2'-O)-methyltransferase RlmB [Buchananella hordeovulneris]
MAGNSQRRGAVRKTGSKKGATKGTGGQTRKGLQGRGPTPKAEDRVYHPAAKRKAAAERRAAGLRAQQHGPRLRPGLQPAAGNELIFGRNPVTEAVRAGIPIARVLMAPGLLQDERVSEVVRTATALGAPLLEVTRGELDKLSDGAVHQGVAIEVPEYEYKDVADLLARAERDAHPPLIIALDGVTDPHNLGAVLRSAGAFGADGVLLPERRSVGMNATAWKVSAGAAARVPVARATNLTRELEYLKQSGCFVVGLDGGGATTVRNLDLATGPLVLVTGSEGKGLSRLVREACDVIASIPISGRVESLNAAVATGIALYEISQLRAQNES